MGFRHRGVNRLRYGFGGQGAHSVHRSLGGGAEAHSVHRSLGGGAGAQGRNVTLLTEGRAFYFILQEFWIDIDKVGITGNNEIFLYLKSDASTFGVKSLNL